MSDVTDIAINVLVMSFLMFTMLLIAFFMRNAIDIGYHYISKDDTSLSVKSHIGASLLNTFNLHTKFKLNFDTCDIIVIIM